MPQPTRWTSCTAQKESGQFCDSPTIPGAPFPVCYRHAAQLYAFCRDRLALIKSNEESAIDFIVDTFAKRDRKPTPDPGGVVYYLQVGDLIKIGTTTRLSTRLKTYPPNRRLLATEPGGPALEAQRHARFTDLLELGREWFRAGPELIEHINTLRKAQGATEVEPKSA